LQPRTSEQIISVSEVCQHARQILERAFPLCEVEGELSNVMRAASGHWYFLLKDGRSHVRCVMYRHRAGDMQLRDGQKVVCRALVTLYEARGEFQLQIEACRPSGLGALYELYLQRKQYYESQGWFDIANKKPLPDYPEQIALVTSLEAAALQDVLTTLKRRSPHLRVLIFAAPVQGKTAAGLLANALTEAQAWHDACIKNCEQGIDAIILCRGGGSIEDLWALILLRIVVRLPPLRRQNWWLSRH
jgi:exodeoxyribonuclease VII large subunit